MTFYEKQCDIVWQGVNSIGHFSKKSISPARTDMKVWNLACNLGYVFTKQGKKRNFPSHLKVCFFVYSIFLYQDWIFFHIWQINYEQTFSIVNDHRSPWNFWCFFRDSNGTKMTHSWIGLTISWCLYHSRYEVWHKCDRENRLIWLYFWPPNLSKSWLWSMYVRHLVPGDVSEQLLLSTKWLVGENCVFLLAKSCFSAGPLYRRNCHKSIHIMV